jgi:hypothetical protein
MKRARISSSMPIILLTGIPGKKKLLRNPGEKINLFFCQLDIPPVIGAM